MKILLMLVLLAGCAKKVPNSQSNCPEPEKQTVYVPSTPVEPEKPATVWYKGDCGIRYDNNVKFKIIEKNDETYYVNAEVKYEIEGKIPEIRVESQVWRYGDFDEDSMKITCEF